MSSIHKLEEQLQEEAENEGVIDYPEFQAAINNMGIDFSKKQLKKIFAHFLGEQDEYHRKMGIPKNRIKGHEYEVKLGFMMDILKTKVENHQHLKPKQIIKLALGELLLNDNQLNKQSSFLIRKKHGSKYILPSFGDNDSDEKVFQPKDQLDENKETDEVVDNDDDDDSFEENEDFDKEINEMNGYQGFDEPPTISSHGGGSLTKGDRALMRMGSTAHWNDQDVKDQTAEMTNQLKMLQEQTSGISQTDIAMIGGNQQPINVNMYQQQNQQKRTYGYY